MNDSATCRFCRNETRTYNTGVHVRFTLHSNESGRECEGSFTPSTQESKPFKCVECGKEFVGEGRLCARCYVSDKI